ncbi:Caspase domain-containing protein [Parasphingorhabdus marina DSM 22363]|uniref:Caspase domain-containing protein n=1 Tax=Parasphingorhabdus marina DSM 22363 TaxID=1123272 RepID=A0A1N6D2F2_9SPHN|nr:caspase family protein [Parasphingorhabdus marina]SIN64978.1 Caspase domain-containing protein [Parasphingorhabdus marina DSM 22363]
MATDPECYPYVRRLLRLLLVATLPLFVACSTEPEFGQAPIDLQPKVVPQSLPADGVEVAAWTRDDRFIITAVGATRSVTIWDVANGHIVDRLRLPAEKGQTGELMALRSIEVSEDGQTAIIDAVTAKFGKDEKYSPARNRRYSLDLHSRKVTAIAAPNDEIIWDGNDIECVREALQVLYEDSDTMCVYDEADEEPQSFEEAVRYANAHLPALPNSHDGIWSLHRKPIVEAEFNPGADAGGLLLVSESDGEERELTHDRLAKFDAASMSPEGRWVAMSNDKMDYDSDYDADVSIIEIYDIQSAKFAQQVRIIGDYNQTNWISDNELVVTQISSSGDRVGEDEENLGPPPDAVIVDVASGKIEDKVEARCYMMPAPDHGFVGAGLANCRTVDNDDVGLQKYDAKKEIWEAFGSLEIPEGAFVDLLALSADGRRLAVVVQRENRQIVGHILDSRTGEPLFSKSFKDISSIANMAFAPDGNSLLVSSNGRVFIWRVDEDKWGPTSLTSLDTTVLERHGAILAVAGEYDDAISLFDFETGETLPALEFGNVSGGGFFPDKPLFWAFSAEDGLRIWDTRNWSVVLTTYFFADQGFLAVTPDGRYDSNIHPYNARFRWLVPDQPFTSLNPDAFSRDYFAPGLTERWISCRVAGNCANSFDPVRPIVELNRRLPQVDIVNVAPGENSAEAIVTIEINETGKPDTGTSGVFDPRIFRNHQLVFRSVETDQRSQNSIASWRSAHAASKAVTKISDGRYRLQKTVTLPTGSRPEDLSQLITAYAFNEDRIKSETAAYQYERPPLPARQPRAYVLTIGIDHYQEQRLNLNFAGNDAILLSDRLSDIPGYDTRQLTIRTVGPNPGDQRAGAPKYVSKQIIRDLLSLLSGLDGSEARKRLDALGINAANLEKATPDDLIIFSYAGHGWTDRTGEFYLVTSQASWKQQDGTPEAEGLVSSRELANWMTDIDAGAMTLIVDACHSAASVENGSFKPGPMGDPGLGQLAFDKGVRILTATQADDVALEDANLKQGLLTYVLAAEGLGEKGGKADLDSDRKIELAEWLNYAVQRLPALQVDARVEGIRSDAVVFHDLQDSQTEKRIQKPSLFDFNILASPIILRTNMK